MKDPVEATIRAFVDLQNTVPDGYKFPVMVCAVSAVAVFIMCMTFTDVWVQENRINKYWTSICDEVINEIDALMPVYHKEMLAYAQMMKRSILNNKGFTTVVASIGEDVKIKAERDYCLVDIHNQAAVDMLQAQFVKLVQQCKT